MEETTQTTTTELTLVNPTEFGIEPSKANDLLGYLPQIRAERAILTEQYNEVIVMDIEEPSTLKKARELRLLIRDNRTKKIEPWHKTTKEVFLRGGQFIDAVKKKEVGENIRMEETLESIERHFENKEKERKAILNTERINELEPFNAFVPMGLNFGEISDEEYAKILNGAKLQFKQQQEEEAEAEKERLRLAEVERLHNERRESLLPLWQFVEDKETNFGELSEELFASIKSVANSKKADHEAEQERISKENERLEKEKAELEAKAKKEREEAEALKKKEELLNNAGRARQEMLFEIGVSLDFVSCKNMEEKVWNKFFEEKNKAYQEEQNKLFLKKLEEERESKKRDQEIKLQQEQKEKLEAELKAKKDAEELAERNRLAEIEKQKQEADKLAKAPVKKQLSVWVNSFSIPETNISNDKTALIVSKFDAFKVWALKEIENI